MRDGTSGFASSKGAPASDARDTSLFTDLHRAPSGITSPTPRTQASHALFHDREVGMVEVATARTTEAAVVEAEEVEALASPAPRRLRGQTLDH